jgi:hypothetical protein
MRLRTFSLSCLSIFFLHTRPCEGDPLCGCLPPSVTPLFFSLMWGVPFCMLHVLYAPMHFFFLSIFLLFLHVRVKRSSLWLSVSSLTLVSRTSVCCSAEFHNTHTHTLSPAQVVRMQLLLALRRFVISEVRLRRSPPFFFFFPQIRIPRNLSSNVLPVFMGSLLFSGAGNLVQSILVLIFPPSPYSVTLIPRPLMKKKNHASHFFILIPSLLVSTPWGTTACTTPLAPEHAEPLIFFFCSSQNQYTQEPFLEKFSFPRLHEVTFFLLFFANSGISRGMHWSRWQ